MAVGKKIKLLRENKNLTRQELAEKIQVTDVTISRYENNKREPNIETLKKIADALDVNPSELLVSDEEEINNEDLKKKGIFSKFAQTIDNVQLNRDMDKAKVTDNFFKSLGYEIAMPTNEEGDSTIVINDVVYTESQFHTLLKMIETCIEDVQELVRNSNN